MTRETLPLMLLWGVLILVIALLPLAVRWFLRKTRVRGLDPDAVRLISQKSIGPQQRVVVVEVGPPHASVQLVLGVTTQSVQCLHRMVVDFNAKEPSHG